MRDLEYIEGSCSQNKNGMYRSIQAFMWIFEEAKNICMKYSKDNLRLEWFLFRKLYDKDIGGKLLKTGTISDFCCILTPSLMGSALVRRTYRRRSNFLLSIRRGFLRYLKGKL